MARAEMKVGDPTTEYMSADQTLLLWLARERNGVSLENRKGDGLSYLHASSRDQTAEYYVEEDLNKPAASATKRKRQNWPPKQVKLPEYV